MELTTEQQFELIKCQNLVQGASKEQLINLYLELYRLSMMKDNAVKMMLRDCKP